MFKKGESGNPAGRPPGAENKASGSLRQRINKFLADNWEQMQQDFEALEPKDRLMFYEKLMQYGLPKLQSTTLTSDFEKMTDEQLEYIIQTLIEHDTTGEN